MKLFTLFTLLAGISHFLFLNSPAWAISEKDYLKHLEKKVTPFYEKSGVAGSFDGKDHVRISYLKFERYFEKAKIVILPGRAEPMRKYAEVIYDLQTFGYSIYIMSHRGQGESERMTPNPQMQYVKTFDDYVEDLNTFMSEVVKPSASKKTLLLAHGMGGAIGTLYSFKNPDVFSAIALTSPLFEMNTDPYPETVAYDLAWAAVKFGMGDRYASKQTDYQPDDSPLGKTTSSEVRAQMSQGVYQHFPETQVGGVSNQWLAASLEGLRTIGPQSPAYKNPVLLIQSGQDQLAKPKGQDEFCRSVSHCEKITFPEALHDILMERDPIRDRVLAQLKSFLFK